MFFYMDESPTDSTANSRSVSERMARPYCASDRSLSPPPPPHCNLAGHAHSVPPTWPARHAWPHSREPGWLWSSCFLRHSEAERVTKWCSRSAVPLGVRDPLGPTTELALPRHQPKSVELSQHRSHWLTT